MSQRAAIISPDFVIKVIITVSAAAATITNKPTITFL
jgi:hypothetical protein